MADFIPSEKRNAFSALADLRASLLAPLAPPPALRESEALLAVEAAGEKNIMTMGWGGVGVLFGVPAVSCFVRPSRYTFGLLEKTPFFTLSFLRAEDPNAAKAIAVCGRRSFREFPTAEFRSKFEAASLTPVTSGEFLYPAQAGLVLFCRTLCRGELGEGGFSSAAEGENLRDKFYRDGDFHRIFFGQILRAACPSSPL